jgi:hypothetical protein
MKVGVADLKSIADLRARVHQKSNRARASCVIDISDGISRISLQPPRLVPSRVGSLSASQRG